MKIKYDAEVDILVIRLREGEYYETNEVTPDVLVDFDEEGNPLAIEILNARQVLNAGEDMLHLEIPVIFKQPV